MARFSKMPLTCSKFAAAVAAAALLLATLAAQECRAGDGKSRDKREYLVEVRLYQSEPASKADSNDRPGGSRPDKKGTATLLTAPRALVSESQPATLHLGKQRGRAGVDGTVSFIDLGTALSLRIVHADQGRLRVELTIERSAGHEDIAAERRDPAVTDDDDDAIMVQAIKVYCRKAVTPGKAVKACEFSNGSQRFWVELMVWEWQPQPDGGTTSATPAKTVRSSGR